MGNAILCLPGCAGLVFFATVIGSCGEGNIEVPVDCVPDCGARVCGPVPNGCGETCGDCADPVSCDIPSGQCQGCTPDCSGRECGLDPQNCGTSCGTCTLPDQHCDTTSGLCQACSPDCGVRVCGPVPNGCGESCGNCADPKWCDFSSGQCLACSPAEPLRASADRIGRRIGVALNGGWLVDGAPPEPAVDLAASEFNYLTEEGAMVWGNIHPGLDSWNFFRSDASVGFAEKKGMRFRGAHLLWHEVLPSYVNDRVTAEQLRSMVDTHIRTVVGRYQGRVYAWNVVNEAVKHDGSGLTDTVFKTKLGEGYIADAFHTAHEADPQALLFYNDFGGEDPSAYPAKSDRIFQLVKNLKESGVPIHGVGMQMHVVAWTNTTPPWELRPDPTAVAANMKRLADLGLLVDISEMDVDETKVSGDMSVRWAAQAEVFGDMVTACVAEPRCDGVTFWGITDKFTWLNWKDPSEPHYPLLFDVNYQKKPAYFAVRDALLTGHPVCAAR